MCVRRRQRQGSCTAVAHHALLPAAWKVGAKKNLQCMLRHGDIFATGKFILCSRSSSLYTNALKGLVRQASRFCGRIHREGRRVLPPPPLCWGPCGVRPAAGMDDGCSAPHIFTYLYIRVASARRANIALLLGRRGDRGRRETRNGY